MSLSNSVTTMIIDPTVFNANRCEFKIADGYLASSIKLVDVGVYSSNIVDRATGVFYPSITGVLASIKKLSLYSGSTLIDEAQELQAYGAIQHLRTSNQGAEDLNRFELLNGFSFAQSAGDYGNMTTEADHKDYLKAYNENPTSAFRRYHNDQVQISNTDNGGASGMLVLSNYLEFLKSVPILPMIPDLRLVIEFNTTASDFYVDGDAPSAVTPSFVPIRPQLMYEIINNVKPEMGLVKIPYTSCIVERFVVPVASAGTTIPSSFRSNAFRGRFLKDLVLFNQPSSDSSWLRAKERSIAQVEEKIQLIVNSRKFLPDDGISSEALKLRYFTDAIGNLNVPLACALSGYEDKTGATNCTLDAHTSAVVSNFSVAGVLIQDVIDRLDIEYSRKGFGAGDQSVAFNLLAFGRVNRLMELKDGVVRLSY